MTEENSGPAFAYGWRITGAELDNLVADGLDINARKEIGTGVNLFSEETIGDQNREFWRVLDDDGYEYFRGVIWGDHYSIEPLDDWAMADSGCTRIQCRKAVTEKWKPVN